MHLCKKIIWRNLCIWRLLFFTFANSCSVRSVRLGSGRIFLPWRLVCSCSAPCGRMWHWQNLQGKQQRWDEQFLFFPKHQMCLKHRFVVVSHLWGCSCRANSSVLPPAGKILSCSVRSGGLQCFPDSRRSADRWRATSRTEICHCTRNAPSLQVTGQKTFLFDLSLNFIDIIYRWLQQKLSLMFQVVLDVSLIWIVFRTQSFTWLQ